MKTKHFLSKVEHDKIHQAIQVAEEGTSGDLVLYISHRRAGDALAAAHTAFTKLNVGGTTDQTLLIFVSPLSHTFAVVGGIVLHEKMGQGWWDDLTALLTRHFKEGQFTAGLLAAITAAGAAFHEHFPATAPDRRGQQDIIEE